MFAQPMFEFEELCAHLAEKGLQPKDILEASLVYNAAFCQEPQVEAVIEFRHAHLQRSKPMFESPQQESIYNIELALTVMPAQIAGIVDNMIRCKLIDAGRALKNWAVIEEFITSHAAQSKAALQH